LERRGGLLRRGVERCWEIKPELLEAVRKQF
jgi:hypothetical protein